jgi:hypothetical protein
LAQSDVSRVKGHKANAIFKGHYYDFDLVVQGKRVALDLAKDSILTAKAQSPSIYVEVDRRNHLTKLKLEGDLGYSISHCWVDNDTLLIGSFEWVSLVDHERLTEARYTNTYDTKLVSDIIRVNNKEAIVLYLDDLDSELRTVELEIANNRLTEKRTSLLHLSNDQFYVGKGFIDKNSTGLILLTSKRKTDNLELSLQTSDAMLPIELGNLATDPYEFYTHSQSAGQFIILTPSTLILPFKVNDKPALCKLERTDGSFKVVDQLSLSTQPYLGLDRMLDSTKLRKFIEQ